MAPSIPLLADGLTGNLHEEEPPQNMKSLQGGDKQLSKTALKKAAKQETKPDDIQEKVLQSQPKPVSPTASAAATSGDPELDKKIKNLKKKIKAIEQLKDQQAAGKPLEKNQIEKLQKESLLLQELELGI